MYVCIHSYLRLLISRAVIGKGMEGTNGKMNWIPYVLTVDHNLDNPKVCMYVCVCICMYVCMYVCIFVCLCVCTFVAYIHLSIHSPSIFPYIRTYIHTYMAYIHDIHAYTTYKERNRLLDEHPNEVCDIEFFMSVCVCVCVCVYVYVCIYVCIVYNTCIHTFTKIARIYMCTHTYILVSCPG